MQSDESRRQRFLCGLAQSDNPARKFEWGNLITLRDNIDDDDLYEAVHEFRKRHYSSHRMTLAVQVVWNLHLWAICCVFCTGQKERGRGIANVKVYQHTFIKFSLVRLLHLCRINLSSCFVYTLCYIDKSCLFPNPFLPLLSCSFSSLLPPPPSPPSSSNVFTAHGLPCTQAS